MFRGDVSRFLVDQHPGVPTKRELVDGEVDLVFGGPPCQGFSQIGPRDRKDPRNLLYLEFARVLKALKPKVFVMENVPNMVAMKNGHFRDLILAALKGAGYHNTILTTLTASHFGVPQHRRRVFFVGSRDDLPTSGDLAARFERFLDTSRTDRETTVAEAISDLPKRVSLDDGPLPYPKLRRRTLSDFQRTMRLDLDSVLIPKQWKRANVDDGGQSLFNHHTKGIEARRQRIVRALKPGMCGDSLPATLWKGSRPYKWRRLHPDEPSYTILAQMQRDLCEWIHPKHDRWITVREAAKRSRRQIHIYAAIIAESLGFWPKKGIIAGASGETVEFGLAPSDCDAEADAAVADLAVWNLALSSAKQASDIASPSDSSCATCRFQLVCPAFWTWLARRSPGGTPTSAPVAAAGILKSVLLGNDGDLQTIVLAGVVSSQPGMVSASLVTRCSIHGILPPSEIGSECRIVGAENRHGALKQSIDENHLSLEDLPSRVGDTEPGRVTRFSGRTPLSRSNTGATCLAS